MDRLENRVFRVCLPAQTEALEQLVMFFEIVLLDVVEELTTTGRHTDQTTTGVEILAMSAKVLGEVLNACCEQRDLYFTGAGILVVSFEITDDFVLINCSI